jgi:hypothetical protein
MADVELAIMKMLTAGPWRRPDTPRGPKLGIAKVVEALGKLGTPGLKPDAIVAALQNVKGPGWVQTDPKIILKEEWPTVEFQLWLTPLGKTELEKRVSASG